MCYIPVWYVCGTLDSPCVQVCVELVKVLLHMSDSYSITDFTFLRHRAMVALTVSCPCPIAQYLTAEFYAPNYTIRQRLDILEVSSPAQCLSIFIHVY